MDVWHYIENKTVYKPNRIPHIFSSYSVEEVDHRNKPIIYACATVILVFFLLEAPKLPSAVLTAFFHRIWTLTLMWLGSFRKVQPVQRLFRKKYMCMQDNPSTDTLKRGLIPLLGYFPHGPFRTFLRVKKKSAMRNKNKISLFIFFFFSWLLALQKAPKPVKMLRLASTPKKMRLFLFQFCVYEEIPISGNRALKD